MLIKFQLLGLGGSTLRQESVWRANVGRYILSVPEGSECLALDGGPVGGGSPSHTGHAGPHSATSPRRASHSTRRAMLPGEYTQNREM